MSSSIASFVLRRTLCRTFLPICKPRCYSSLAFSSLLIPRVLTGQTLSKAIPAISIRFASSASASASSKALSSDDKIKRADENLLRVLESEIECAEDPEDGPSQEVVVPKDSPFEIIDNPGDQSIILKREFQGEKIQVTVFSNFEEQEDDEDHDEENNDKDEDDNASQQNISLVVTINKGAGPTLEFCCILYSDTVEIESLAMKRPEDAADDEGAYQGPEFSDLDESLQKAFLKYLAARGIKGSLYNFLHEYMMTKEDKEYVVWLKNLKEFVAK